MKLELTQGMIEISTGVHTRHDALLAELEAMRGELSAAARKLNIAVAGGGTHPFQHWAQSQISKGERFHFLSELYGYLAKQFTVFGQHVHVGCPAPDEALWLLHCLSHYIPHFIALSASSPFVQGHDTGFQSARLNSVFAFPLSGRAPCVTRWSEFVEYFDKMTRTGVVKSMKDFYWDIRPKPEYGTIEIRVFDTPLSVAKAADLAAFAQALARHLMIERPFEPTEDHYLVYTFNRFQACRFGLDGIYVDPRTGEHRVLRDELLATLARIEPHAIELGADRACANLLALVRDGLTDARWCRETHAAQRSFSELVHRQSRLWMDTEAP